MRAAGSESVEWGPAADRTFMFTPTGGRIVLSDVDRIDDLGLTPLPIPQGWSRPKGLAFLWVSPDSSRLLKVDAATGKKQDVTFLKRTDEAVYHPAGEHILAVGEDDEGTYGVFLATNEGTEEQPLVVGESARRIYSLAFGPTGSLYYAAEHPTHYDVHRVTFQNSPDTGTVKTQLQTLYTTTDPIEGISVSPFSDRKIAVQVGSCDSKTILARGSINGPIMGSKTTEKLQGAAAELDAPLSSLSTAPVGWLPNGRLVVRARDEGCEGASDLYVSSSHGSELLADQVDLAAVRVALPDPPPPPNQEPEVVA